MTKIGAPGGAAHRRVDYPATTRAEPVAALRAARRDGLMAPRRAAGVQWQQQGQGAPNWTVVGGPPREVPRGGPTGGGGRNVGEPAGRRYPGPQFPRTPAQPRVLAKRRRTVPARVV